MYEKTISDPKKFEMIKARERAIRDYAGRMAYEGKQGIEQGLFQSAKNMLRDKMPVDLVAKYCGLPIDQIKTIQI